MSYLDFTIHSKFILFYYYFKKNQIGTYEYISFWWTKIKKLNHTNVNYLDSFFVVQYPTMVTKYLVKVKNRTYTTLVWFILFSLVFFCQLLRSYLRLRRIFENQLLFHPLSIIMFFNRYWPTETSDIVLSSEFTRIRIQTRIVLLPWRI